MSRDLARGHRGTGEEGRKEETTESHGVHTEFHRGRGKKKLPQ